jgi:flagellar hook assembly protein FlgD
MVTMIWLSEYGVQAAGAPNPFSETTTLKLALNESGHVRLLIYNLAGEFVRTLFDRKLEAGGHSISWDGWDYSGRRVTPGVYLCKGQFDRPERSQTPILLRLER